MKYLPYVVIAFIAGLLLYFGFFNVKRQPSENSKTEQSTDTSRVRWETKTDDRPPIAIRVTPVEFGTTDGVWKFDIAFDTHSGSLDQDLTQITVLLDDKGGAYQPTAWEGPGPGGHHREGVLVFNAINPIPSFVELKITDVGGISERLFKWDLE